MLAPVHRTKLWLAGFALVALVALFATLSGDWLYGDDPVGLVSASLGWHHEAPRSSDVPLETFLPGQKRDLSPAQAMAENIASPLEPRNPAPPPFLPAWLDAAALGRAGECLATAIYYEAGGEPQAGQLAVAQVVLNRLRHPRFPKSVCEVVYQGAGGVSGHSGGCQFTFACDGSLVRRPDAAGLAHARAVADLALHGAISGLAGQATHYHTVWIVPVWAHEMRKVAIIGHHVFYRPPGAYGSYPVLNGAERAPGSAPAGAASPVPDGLPIALRGADSAQTAPVVLDAAHGDHSPTAETARRAIETPAPAATTGSQRPSYFAAPRRRQGSLALPNMP